MNALLRIESPLIGLEFYHRGFSATRNEIPMKFGRFKSTLLALVALMFLSAIPALTSQSVPGAGSVPSTSSAGKLLDINSASLSDLKSLPGIGDAYAQKIIDGRPYANKTQLKSKDIIPSSVYDKIANLVIAKQPPKTPK